MLQGQGSWMVISLYYRYLNVASSCNAKTRSLFTYLCLLSFESAWVSLFCSNYRSAVLAVYIAVKSMVLKGNNENLVAFLRDGLSKLWLCPAGRSWKPILKRAHIRWPNKVYAIDLLSEINFTIFKLLEDADAFALLQRDAGKAEGFEWRWKQPKVKSSCSSIFLILFLFNCFVYIINYLLPCILVRFYGTFNLYSRWLFVTEEDIKALPCFHVSIVHHF